MRVMDAEKMRSSVLAYCEEVCPNVGDGHKETVNSGTIIHSKDRAWSWLDGLGSRIYINDNMSRATATAMYAILGLEARDAVEAEKSRLLKRYKARIKRLRADDAETHRIQMEVKDERIAELQTRNAALVAALEVVKQRCEELGTGCEIVDGQFVAIEGSDYEVVCKALTANTEKGGANE